MIAQQCFGKIETQISYFLIEDKQEKIKTIGATCITLEEKLNQISQIVEQLKS